MLLFRADLGDCTVSFQGFFAALLVAAVQKNGLGHLGFEEAVVGFDRIVKTARQQADRHFNRGQIFQLGTARVDRGDGAVGHAIGHKEGAGVGKVGISSAGIVETKVNAVRRLNVDQDQVTAEPAIDQQVDERLPAANIGQAFGCDLFDMRGNFVEDICDFGGHGVQNCLAMLEDGGLHQTLPSVARFAARWDDFGQPV